MGKLTPKQIRFCEEYLIDLNATDAAKRAGYSKKTASEQAYQLRDKPAVQAKIKELMDGRSEETKIDAAWVLKRLSHIADLDPKNIFNEHGHLFSVANMPEEVRRSISSIEVLDAFEGSGRDRTKVGETTKIKMCDKVKALELIGRHLMMFVDVVKQTDDDDKMTLEQIDARLAQLLKKKEGA